MIDPRLCAVIMAGGSGERFWPRSRAKLPKHLLDIVSPKSMLQLTVDRVLKKIPPRRVYIVTSRAQAALVRRQIRKIPAANIIAEPMGRDTAPCIAYAAALIARRDPRALMWVLPADHVIGNTARLWRLVERGCAAVSDPVEGRLMTFGIVPAGPRTGYGYIERGKEFPVRGGEPFYQVRRFTEKPDLENAKRYVASGRFYWNSGMFLWSVETVLECFRRFAPEIFRGVQALRRSSFAPAAVEKVYAAFPKISIDYAVMEKSDRVLVAPGDFLWNDVGAWPSVREYMKKDAGGNAFRGTAAALESSGCTVVSSPRHLVALLGVKGLVVVHTPDATLVCPESRAEELKKLLGVLKQDEKLRRFV